MAEFDNKVAIVTGSTSGIGEATARVLVAAGAKVILNSSSSVKAGKVLASELGKSACYHRADVSSESDPYSVSKAAINHTNHLNHLMANVLGPEIRGNAVAPELVETPWTETWDAIHEAVAERAPLGRSATPDDCAAAVLGILCAGYQTGDVVVVNGGLTLA